MKYRMEYLSRLEVCKRRKLMANCALNYHSSWWLVLRNDKEVQSLGCLQQMIRCLVWRCPHKLAVSLSHSHHQHSKCSQSLLGQFVMANSRLRWLMSQLHLHEGQAQGHSGQHQRQYRHRCWIQSRVRSSFWHATWICTTYRNQASSPKIRQPSKLWFMGPLTPAIKIQKRNHRQHLRRARTQWLDFHRCLCCGEPQSEVFHQRKSDSKGEVVLRAM